jgi:hypothetical protein
LIVQLPTINYTVFTIIISTFSYFNLTVPLLSDDTEDRAAKADEARNRAWAFLLRIIKEVEKHLPANMAVFKQMSFFSPSRILSSSPPRFAEMPFIECISSSEDLSELEELWRQVTQVKFVTIIQSRLSQCSIPKM